MDEPTTLVYWLLAAVLATVVLSFLLQVDNWKRDLLHNEAETSEDVLDEALRPLRTTLPSEQVSEAVRAVAKGLRGWQLVDQQSDGEGIHLTFVRTTSLFRFRDDIGVHIVHLPGAETEVRAHSASRLGMGDLGQNPRNLKELLVPLREALSPPAES